MSTLIRAIISGFGLKLGQDLYRLINRKLGVFPEDDERGGGKVGKDEEEGEIEARPGVLSGLSLD
ncbi:MAG: hypothetical protein IPK80_24970 [Nannocystis sp.]|nr:hypothetical protein [Nannocystis sp.]